MARDRDRGKTFPADPAYPISALTPVVQAVREPTRVPGLLDPFQLQRAFRLENLPAISHHIDALELLLNELEPNWRDQFLPGV